MEFKIGIVKRAHNPRAACPHNDDPALDCTCKRKRNPWRKVKVHDPSVTLHKVQPDIIITIHPNGLLELREKGKRKSLSTTVGIVYEGLVIGEARKVAQLKKKGRKK